MPMNTATAHPSFLPPSIDSVPPSVRREKGYWEIHPELKLTLESANEFIRGSLVTHELYENKPLLKTLDLDSNLPGTESLKGHGMRVAILSLLLNDELERQGSELQGDSRILTTASFLHDIGKLRAEINEVIMQPRKILKGDTKSASDALAWTIIRRHPRVGFNAVSNMFELDSDERNHVAWAIYCHHEKQDGKGYHRLPIDRVSKESQIISITDAFDVMTGNRPHQRKKTTDAAIKELRRCNRQFNSELVEIFANLRPEEGEFIRYKLAA